MPSKPLSSALPCSTLPCPPRHALPCPVLSCPVLSSPVQSSPVQSSPGQASPAQPSPAQPSSAQPSQVRPCSAFLCPLSIHKSTRPYNYQHCLCEVLYYSVLLCYLYPACPALHPAPTACQALLHNVLSYHNLSLPIICHSLYQSVPSSTVAFAMTCHALFQNFPVLQCLRTWSYSAPSCFSPCAMVYVHSG